ncbi:major facilitator superfamily domain-containing protein [Dipodascopsis uninucleata]
MGVVSAFKKFINWLDTATGWYTPDMSMEERNLVRKIDLFVLGYCCLAFFTKYLDVSALTYAYLSGMKDDLQLTGNRLNYINAVYQVGYCAFQIPSNMLITKIPSQYYLPTAEIIWGLFTLGTAFVKTYEQLLAMRFFVGFGATACYVGCLHIVNSWYTKAELGRRNAIYYSAMPLGSMIAGYIQGALYTMQTGTLKPWQWLFIVCAIVTVPIALFGYIFFPDVPERTTSRWFTAREKEMAFARLQKDGFERSKGLNKTLIKRVFLSWQFWTFVWMGNLFWLAPYGSGTPFSLWLQDVKYPTNVTAVDNVSTATYGISIVSALICAVYSDWRSNRWEMMLFAGILMIVGNVMLLVYDIPENAIFAAYMLLGISNGPANLVVAWAAETFAHDVEARAITLATINATNCMLYLVIPLGAWQTEDAPKFFAGYITSVAMSVVQVILIPLAVIMQRRDQRKLRAALDTAPTIYGVEAGSEDGYVMDDASMEKSTEKIKSVQLGLSDESS